jgi:hypothetical protein
MKLLRREEPEEQHVFLTEQGTHKSGAAIIKMEWRSEQIRVHSTAKSMGFRRYFPPLLRSDVLWTDLWLRFGLKWPPSPTELCGPRRKKWLNEPAGIGGTGPHGKSNLHLTLVEISDPILAMSLFKSETEWRASSKAGKIGTKRMIRVENGTVRFMLGSLGTCGYWHWPQEIVEERNYVDCSARAPFCSGPKWQIRVLFRQRRTNASVGDPMRQSKTE